MKLVMTWNHVAYRKHFNVIFCEMVSFCASLKFIEIIFPASYEENVTKESRGCT